MSASLPRRLSAGLLGALLAPALPLAAAERVPAKAELIAESTSLVPGVNWVALRLTPDPGWHVYWINPGDSGQTTSLAFKLPAGVSAGEIAWPAPHSFRFGALTSYGYSEEVLHLVPITVEVARAAGSSVKLAAEARWLVCQEACIPGKAALSLDLPFAKDAGKAKADSRWQAAFARARAALPRADETQKSTFSATGEKLTLTIAGAMKQADESEFFPENDDLVDHSAPQQLAFADGAWRLEQKLSPYFSEAPPTLRGILVLHRGAATEAWQIEASSTATAKSPKN